MTPVSSVVVRKRALQTRFGRATNSRRKTAKPATTAAKLSVTCTTTSIRKSIGRTRYPGGSVWGGAQRRATSLIKASGAPERSSGIVSATASSSGSTQPVISSAGKFCKT